MNSSLHFIRNMLNFAGSKPFKSKTYFLKWEMMIFVLTSMEKVVLVA